MKKTIFSILTLFVLFAIMPNVSAKTIQVVGNNSEAVTDALATAANGDTIQLTEDITLSDDDDFINVSASNKSIILDLAKHTVTSTSKNKATIIVDDDTTVTITGNGTVKHTNNQPALIVKNGDVTIENGTFAVDTAPYYAIHLGDLSDNTREDLTNTLHIKNATVSNSKSGGIIVLTKHSKLDIDNINLNCQDNTAISTHSTISDVTININGGTYTAKSVNKQADGIGILGSNITLNINGGTIKADDVGINSNNSSKNKSTINIKGGTINAHVGIYQPQKADLNISGGTIEGSIGIVARQGLVNITGGTIKGIAGDDEEPFSVGYKGHELTPGSAFVVDNQPTSYGDDLVAKISGGRFESSTDEAIISYEGNDTDYIITGGEYNKPFNSNFIAGSKVEVKIGENYYVGKEAEKAIQKAKPGTTVTVLQGDVDVSNIASGVTVENKGTGNVVVNGKEVSPDSKITIPAVSTAKKETVSNPETVDNIIIYIVLLLTSTISLIYFTRKSLS